MRKIQCAGCGMTEALDSPRHEIKSVKVIVSMDDRFSTQSLEYNEDLCLVCVGKLTHNYFGVKAAGLLDVPAFIETNNKLELVS